LAAVNAAILGIPSTPHASAAPDSVSGTLHLLAANVEVGNTDFAGVERLVAQTHPDLFGVTELTPAMASHLAVQLPGYRMRVLEARRDAYGIGVYSRRPLQSAKVVHFPADGPPTAVVRVRVA